MDPLILTPVQLSTLPTEARHAVGYTWLEERGDLTVVRRWVRVRGVGQLTGRPVVRIPGGTTLRRVGACWEGWQHAQPARRIMGSTPAGVASALWHMATHAAGGAPCPSSS